MDAQSGCLPRMSCWYMFCSHHIYHPLLDLFISPKSLTFASPPTERPVLYFFHISHTHTPFLSFPGPKNEILNPCNPPSLVGRRPRPQRRWRPKLRQKLRWQKYLRQGIQKRLGSIDVFCCMTIPFEVMDVVFFGLKKRLVTKLDMICFCCNLTF